MTRLWNDSPLFAPEGDDSGAGSTTDANTGGNSGKTSTTDADTSKSVTFASQSDLDALIEGRLRRDP